MFGASSQPGFSFGVQQPAAASPFGGATSAALGTSLFGTPAASSAFAFGPVASSAPASSSFSFSPATGSFGFGSVASRPAMIGTGSTTFSFGPAAQPQATSALQPASATSATNYLSQLVTSVCNPQLYGDERDGAIARLNQIQAFCGTGLGYYLPNTPPIAYTAENPFCRFKFVGFNRLAEIKDEDGLISLIIKKSADEVRKNRQLLCDCLYKILGSKPQISVQIELIKPLPENRCETVIYIVEMNPATNAKRRVPASEVYQFLSQTLTKSQLQSNASVEDIAINANLNEEKLKEYLAVAPPGFDPTIWMQAQKDNPKPGKLIPWPFQGYEQLRYRRRLQLQEIELQKCYIQELVETMVEIEKSSLAMQAKLLEMQTTQNTLSNRLLSVIGSQMMHFREGFSLDSTEESLKARLDRISAYLNGPLQLKSKITELLSQIRSRPECLAAQEEKCDIEDKDLSSTVKYLKECQEFLEKMVSLVQSDIKDVKEMKATLGQSAET